MLITSIKSMRIPFLILTPVILFFGLSLSGESINTDFLLIIIAGIFAHISVNTLNEYEDFKSGLDYNTKKTPFSGGSGGLIKSPKDSKKVLLIAISSIFITIAFGIYFIYQTGLKILPIGLTGILIIYTYTKWINKSAILCLITPGLAFGPLMILGTNTILIDSFSLTTIICSFIPFFLSNNLLLLNQIPDINADKIAGRNHFPIRFGINKTLLVYGVFSLIAYFIIITEIILNNLPTLCYISLFPMIFSIITTIGIFKNQKNIDKIIPFLGMNVFVVISVPVLLTIGILFGS